MELNIVLKRILFIYVKEKIISLKNVLNHLQRISEHQPRPIMNEATTMLNPSRSSTYVRDYMIKDKDDANADIILI